MAYHGSFNIIYVLRVPLEIVVINKVESFTPCTALNQNVFLLWIMDFYLSFWDKKAWAINLFGIVPSIRFIGAWRKGWNVGETIKYFWRCLVSKHYGSRTDMKHDLSVCSWGFGSANIFGENIDNWTLSGLMKCVFACLCVCKSSFPSC